MREYPANETALERYSFHQLMRSRYHAFWFHLEQGLSRARGVYHERPAGELTALSLAQRVKIDGLRRRFGVRFEWHCEEKTALKCYDDYLDILDQAWTAWCPFVMPAPVLAWRLPLSTFSPLTVFSRIAVNLNRQGRFVMVNQGPEESEIAMALCHQAGLKLQSFCEVRSTIRQRLVPPVVSSWIRN